MSSTDENQSRMLSTTFAPAERASQDQIGLESATVAQTPLVGHLLNSLPHVALILNKERQIVFCNEFGLRFLGIGNAALANGQRFGEAVGCVHSRQSEGGCGTTEHCSTCGAINAILAAQEQGKLQVRECRLTRDGAGGQDSAEFAVWANQVEMGGEKFTLLSAVDISDAKRRQVLEEVFFHDIRNTAANLLTCFEMIKEGISEEKDFLGLAYSIAGRLLAQIDAHQGLAAAEGNELVVKTARIDVERCVQELVSQYRNDESAKSKDIRIESSDLPAKFTSDPVLLQRVLSNMLKNALEASRPYQTVTIGWQVSGDRIRFRVHNPGVMPRDVQLQVFQRSFSTKGRGRGVGTHSMKLLSERYLQGTVSFISSEDGGTTFTAEYPLLLVPPSLTATTNAPAIS